MTVRLAGDAGLDAAARERWLGELAGGAPVDVLVVGGGVTGAGVALDAASRGLSVALVERRDLATGTSRWSSKLVHGGLRYLGRGDVRIAYESARERHLLLTRTAPHLVRPLPLLLPEGPHVARVPAAVTATGIRLGDGLRLAAGTRGAALPRARRVGRVEALRWAPGVRAAGLRGGLLYWDAQLEDDARLVVALARTAAACGARVLTYCAALAVGSGGARVRDELGGGEFEIRARHVVNATGVWAQALAPGVRLRPSRGAHLVVPLEALGSPRCALTVPVPGRRNRYVFALPHPDGVAYVGLTDDADDGPPVDAPAVTDADERFLLDTLGGALERPLGHGDVVGRFAGLRPLLVGAGEGDGPRATADLSRRHQVLGRPGEVLTVVGGKLTTYRRMARDVVDLLTDAPCRTASLPLVGARGPAPRGVPARLVRRYGAEAGEVWALASADPGLARPVAEGVPVLGCEFAFAVRREGALTVDDVLDRRTRLGLVPAWRAAAEPAAAAVLGAGQAGQPRQPGGSSSGSTPPPPSP